MKAKSLLYNCRNAAFACGVDPKTWRAWSDLGFTPKPVVIGKSHFWRVDELGQWIDAGCPHRDEWTYRGTETLLDKNQAAPG